MSYKSRGNYSTGVCFANCQCYFCKLKRKEEAKKKEKKNGKD